MSRFVIFGRKQAWKLSEFHVANFLYEQSVLEELNERSNLRYHHDYEIIDLMIEEVNHLGYNLRYETDLRLRKFHDKNLIPIYEKYYLQFENIGFAEDTLGMVAVKGFTEVIPIIQNLYNILKQTESLHQIASCDNAFYRIADKKSVHVFLGYLNNEEDVIRLPLTMNLLAKWKIVEAKEKFLQYLNSHNRDVVFTAMEALSYYDDPQGVIEQMISQNLKSPDKDIVYAAKKSLKRLRKT